ncbi:endonuclease/exonuclease/phosphatase family protein [Pedobacter cryotolerans]|uniref:Endonuclease n=1 Tax=Pedobacter cryotolerans TaxID=2571270 RepID=A0A4U1C8E1_9SPHI|nr:endonuclease/exonuclease/phosphatase family protein [Pedobacter cryotolerans]TKC02622.1 endonuclease [Pedobacter cryotolerans]
MYYSYCFATALLIIATLVPLIRHDSWVFRVFEYPRLQKLTLNVLLLAAGLIFYAHTTTNWVFIVLLTLNLAYLIYQVFPFTRFGKQQIIKSRFPSGDKNISLLIANVYQDNKNSKAYLNLITECDADVILMVETNLWWQQQIDVIGERYPHQLKIPLENTYGMIFYSKLELKDGSINYLVEEDIPSIEVDVQLRSGQWVKLYCLHPQPPVPQENPRSTERDKEILMVAKKAKECKLPVIVMGDLNDVAWSYTTQLFGKVSGLLDPRRGRGFFNSFNAKYFFLRFPLDHIFCSANFTLTGINRMQSCGSDHFPMCVNLQFDPPADELNEEPEADREDLELANEKINAAT